MKKLSIIIVSLLSVLVLTDSSKAGDLEEIKALSDGFLKALSAGDIDSMVDILHGSMGFTDHSSGVVDKNYAHGVSPFSSASVKISITSTGLPISRGRPSATSTPRTTSPQENALTSPGPSRRVRKSPSGSISHRTVPAPGLSVLLAISSQRV